MSAAFQRFCKQYLVEKDDGSEGVFVAKPGIALFYDGDLILSFYAGEMHVLNHEMVDADEEVLRDELQLRYDEEQPGKLLVKQYDTNAHIFRRIQVFSAS